LLRGRPDFLALDGKTAVLLLDFKFSRANAPFENHIVQAEVYGLLAQLNGFSTQNLCLGIVFLPQTERVDGIDPMPKDARLSLLNSKGTLHEINERCHQEAKILVESGFRRRKVESERWTAHLFRYDERKANGDLDWALKYWLLEREPIPEKKHARKCAVCPMNALRLCEHALSDPDPKIGIQRRPTGRTARRP
jgi:hypothetical protein